MVSLFCVNRVLGRYNTVYILTCGVYLSIMDKRMLGVLRKKWIEGVV